MTDIISKAPLVELTDEQCLDPTVAGAKAAALARCRHAGLPVMEGTVLTTAFATEIDRGTAVVGHPALDEVLERFGDRPLIVRSSSTAEDAEQSSMAGRFETVSDVRGREALEEAVTAVLDSRRRAAEGTDLAPDHPMAVLIQPFAPARMGGVLFGVEPVSGRTDRLAVVAAEDADDVVSGDVQGTRNEIAPDGERVDDADDETLPASLRRSLARLARQLQDTFGGPQDCEWMVDEHDDLVLLQSRPVTTTVRGVPQGPLYGPGPVAETFPDPLRPLERDLWVPPLREAMRQALVLAGATREKTARRRPVVIAPAGRVAVDLEITGEVDTHDRSWLHRLNPGRLVTRVRTAWQVGRLRAALPGIALDLVARTDDALSGVGDLAALADRQLLALIDRCRSALVSLHAHEILMGLVVDPDAPAITGASVGLRVLREARRDGHHDDDIVLENPVVLALAPPRVAARAELPVTPEHVPPVARSGEEADVAGIRREALRLRVRWVQELEARTAWEIGNRLVAAGMLRRTEDVTGLELDSAREALLGRSEPCPARTDVDDLDPLPGTFRMSDTGFPIPVRRHGVADETVGAGGGVGRGPVTHDADDPQDGSVLVIDALRPDLAPVLGRLAGLVSETGSPLAHLAILAREADVPTLVGVADALARFDEGVRIEVDGTSGRLRVLDDDEQDGGTA